MDPLGVPSAPAMETVGRLVIMAAVMRIGCSCRCRRKSEVRHVQYDFTLTSVRSTGRAATLGLVSEPSKRRFSVTRHRVKVGAVLSLRHPLATQQLKELLGDNHAESLEVIKVNKFYFN